MLVRDEVSQSHLCGDAPGSSHAVGQREEGGLEVIRDPRYTETLGRS